MSNNIEMLNSLTACQFGANFYTSLHDSEGEARVWLRFPIALLITASQDGASAGSPSHDVASLFWAIICAREGEHCWRDVPHHYNLASCGNHRLVLDTTKFRGRQSGTIDHEVSGSAGVMDARGGCICNVFENCPLHDDTVFQTLRNQPRQVDGSVNTDRREARGVVDSWFELRFWDFAELFRVT